MPIDFDLHPQRARDEIAIDMVVDRTLAFLRPMTTSIRSRYESDDALAAYRQLVAPIILSAIHTPEQDEAVSAIPDEEALQRLEAMGQEWSEVGAILHAALSVGLISLSVVNQEPPHEYRYQLTPAFAEWAENPDLDLDELLRTQIKRMVSGGRLESGQAGDQGRDGKKENLPTGQRILVDDPYLSNKADLDLVLPPVMESAVDVLYAQLVEFEGKKPTPKSAEKLRHTLSVVLANLVAAYGQDESKYVALSTWPNSYSSSRHNRWASWRMLERVLGFLLAGEGKYLTLLEGTAFDEKTKRGRTTRVRATREIINKLLFNNKKYIQTLGQMGLDQGVAEAVAVEESATGTAQVTADVSPSVITCNKMNLLFSYRQSHDRETIQLKGPKPNQLLRNYPDNDNATAMRERLAQWNRFMDEHWIDILLSDADFQNVYREHKAVKQDDYTPHHIDLQRRLLYRVFNNDSWDQGGRFYGGWWQHIPGRLRPHITINWVPTTELDYSNMQINMLYAREGVKLEGDAYELEGVDSSFRPVIKKAMLKLINATGRIKSIKQDLLPDGWDWKAILSALMEKHDPIKKHFRSGVGLKLQKMDSDIAEQVMLRMMEHGKLALPIHDSFIVQFCDHHLLYETMKGVYRDYMGQDIKVDDDYPFSAHPVNRLPDFDYEGGYLADAVDEYEGQHQFAGYQARKEIWLSRQDHEWKRKHYPRSD